MMRTTNAERLAELSASLPAAAHPLSAPAPSPVSVPRATSSFVGHLLPERVFAYEPFLLDFTASAPPAAAAGPEHLLWGFPHRASLQPKPLDLDHPLLNVQVSNCATHCGMRTLPSFPIHRLSRGPRVLAVCRRSSAGTTFSLLSIQD